MRKFIKAFLLVIVVLISWNVAVKDGHAANNTLSTAQEINYEHFRVEYPFTDDELITLDKDNYKYVKYYKINIPIKTELNVFGLGGQGSIQVSLLNEKGQIIEQASDESEDYSMIELAKDVTPGTYYVMIEANNTIIDLINVQTENYIYETEPNNTMASANKIDVMSVDEVRGKYYGQNGTDVDYYKFTLKNELTHIDFDFGSYDKRKVSLLDANGKEVTDEYGDTVDEYLSPYLPAGTYYIKITNGKGNYGEDYSFNINAQKATPPVKVSDVNVTNTTTKDTIKLKNLKVGWEYKIIMRVEDDGFSYYERIAQFTAKKTTETIVLEHIQLNEQGGSISINAYDNENLESGYITVNYTAQPTSSIKASNITINNNFNSQDSISFKNLVKGATYTIYKDASKKTKLTSFTADGKTKTVKVKQLGAKAGSVYITVTKPKYKESAPTKVSYKAEKLPALAAKNVTITNNSGNDKIVLKGLTKDNTYTIYTDSKLKKKLTSFKATSTTKTLSVKQVGAKAGAVYVVASKSGYTSSSVTKVSFKGQPTAALSSKNVKVTNAKSKDTIKLSGLKKGTTYVIYKDAKKKTKLASFKATETTKTVTVKQLGTNAGKFYITAQASGYSVSALTTVSYSKEK